MDGIFDELTEHQKLRVFEALPFSGQSREDKDARNRTKFRVGDKVRIVEIPLHYVGPENVGDVGVIKSIEYDTFFGSIYRIKVPRIRRPYYFPATSSEIEKVHESVNEALTFIGQSEEDQKLSSKRREKQMKAILKKAKFKVGDRVFVRHSGQTYDTYRSEALRMNLDMSKWRLRAAPRHGDIGKVIRVSVHEDFLDEGSILYGVAIGPRQYIIGEPGLLKLAQESVNEALPFKGQSGRDKKAVELSKKARGFKPGQKYLDAIDAITGLMDVDIIYPTIHDLLDAGDNEGRFIQT